MRTKIEVYAYRNFDKAVKKECIIYVDVDPKTLPQDKRVRLSISADKPRYVVGEKIPVTLTFENLGPLDGEEITVPDLDDPLLYRLTRNGKSVTITLPDEIELSPAKIHHMGIDATHEEHIDLLQSPLRDYLETPGKYTLQLTVPFPKSPDAYWQDGKSLVSDILEFEIVVPPAPEDSENGQMQNQKHGGRAARSGESSGGTGEPLTWHIFAFIGIGVAILAAGTVYFTCRKRKR